MSGFDEAYVQVRGELAATPGKRVLVVEGIGDVEFLTFMLDKAPLRERNAHVDWVFGSAGGKDNVLRMLQRRPDWFGLVDRDAWSEEQIREVARRLPNLRLLPRYCIENFFVDPAALKCLADEAPKARRKQATEAMRAIQEAWPHAIRHGSLWRAIQPLQDELQELGFNGSLLRFSLPDDAEVRGVLRRWSELIDEERIYASYQRFFSQGCSMVMEKAQRLWVHGKMFWRHVVVPLLGEALEESSEARLRRMVQRRMPLPDDMRAMLEALFGGAYGPGTQA